MLLVLTQRRNGGSAFVKNFASDEHGNCSGPADHLLLQGAGAADDAKSGFSAARFPQAPLRRSICAAALPAGVR